MALLISATDRPFCMHCVAAALGVSGGAARSATLMLGLGFDRRYGECSRCGENRLVVAHRRRPGRAT
jgi:hypothetical protein